MSLSFYSRRPRKTDLRSVFVIVVLTVTCASAVASAPDAEAQASRPSSASSALGEIAATRLFCETGPDVAVARGRALLAASFVTEAALLPNPTLSSAHDRSVTADGEHETVIGIEVPLGIGGRRGLLQSAAAARQAQAQLETSHGRVISALSFRRTFVKASLTRARLDLLNVRQNTLVSLVEKLDKLHDGGDRARLDRDRLRVEAALSAANMDHHKREVKAHRVWLEIVLGAPVDLSDGALRMAEGGRPSVDDSSALNLKVAALTKAAEASEIEASAARRRWVPELAVFAGYRMVGGRHIDVGHGLSLGISLPLTFFDHGQAEAERAKAQAAFATAAAARERRLARAATQAARARLAEIARTRPGVKKAIEMARQAERGIERLYLAGESKLLDVLQAARSRSEMELVLIDLAAAESDAWLSLARARGHFAEKALDAACSGASR
jgi:cobalt-zinc-cadmium efflux system outer membrane protein